MASVLSAKVLKVHSLRLFKAVLFAAARVLASVLDRRPSPTAKMTRAFQKYYRVKEVVSLPFSWPRLLQTMPTRPLAGDVPSSLLAVKPSWRATGRTLP